MLPSRQKGAVTAAIEAAFLGAFTLLLPAELSDELADAVASKPYLAERISAADVEELLSALRAVAEVIPTIDTPIPRVCRDADDDYLLAYALVGEADYLVTGDADLLALGRIERTPIVSPAEFLEATSGGGRPTRGAQ